MPIFCFLEIMLFGLFQPGSNLFVSGKFYLWLYLFFKADILQMENTYTYSFFLPWLKYFKLRIFISFFSIIAQPKRCLFRIQTSANILCCPWKCFMGTAPISGSSTPNALKWSQNPPRRNRVWRMLIVSFIFPSTKLKV